MPLYQVAVTDITCHELAQEIKSSWQCFAIAQYDTLESDLVLPPLEVFCHDVLILWAVST